MSKNEVSFEDKVFGCATFIFLFLLAIVSFFLYLHFKNTAISEYDHNKLKSSIQYKEDVHAENILFAKYSDNSDEDIDKFKIVEHKIFERINKDRQSLGLSILKYDEIAAKAGREHCKDMVINKYFAHWDRDGLKPYYRFSLVGGEGHVEENIGIRYYKYGFQYFSSDLKDLLEEALGIHRNLLNERPPKNGHRKNIVNPYHTHVGVGFYMKDSRLTLCEEFVDKYGTMNVSYNNNQFYVSGSIPNGYKIHYIRFNFENIRKMTVNALNLTGGYPDYANEHRVIWAREIDFDPLENTFSVSIPVYTLKNDGYYFYLQLVKNNKSFIANSTAFLNLE